jgi:23S rRNA pseudouridine2605 synthase
MAAAAAPSSGTVPRNRALSKLAVLSRSQASEAILDGRVTVDGRTVRDPLRPVVPERAAITVDGVAARKPRSRTIVFHKPRGVVTTRRDPQGRRTIYDVLGSAGAGLIAAGRLDFASSGLLILTNDTQLADRITDPRQAVPRLYAVTVRGEVTAAALAKLTRGLTVDGERLRAAAATVRKASRRESHVLIELREGKNREVRRLSAANAHDVTRLNRVQLGGLEIGEL